MIVELDKTTVLGVIAALGLGAGGGGGVVDFNAKSRLKITLQAAHEKEQQRLDAIQGVLDQREAAHRLVMESMMRQYSDGLRIIADNCNR